MSRQNFRLLVVINQILLFGIYFVQELTDRTLPPPLRDFLGLDGSVLDSEAGAAPFLDTLPYYFDLAFVFASLVGAVGLCLGRRWGRTIYFLSFVGSVLVTPLSPFHVSTGWTSLVSSLFGTTEGMILALAYFSHLKRMFESRSDDEADDEEDTSR